MTNVPPNTFYDINLDDYLDWDWTLTMPVVNSTWGTPAFTQTGFQYPGIQWPVTTALSQAQVPTLQVPYSVQFASSACPSAMPSPAFQWTPSASSTPSSAPSSAPLSPNIDQLLDTQDDSPPAPSVAPAKGKAKRSGPIRRRRPKRRRGTGYVDMMVRLFRLIFILYVLTLF